MTEQLVLAVIQVVVGIVFIFLGFHQDTRLRGALSYGEGPGAPISTVGRVIVIALGLFVFCLGIRTLSGFWR